MLNVEDNCQYWLNLEDMKLMSPNYPKWYFADGKGCDWLLTAPAGNIIALEFNDFEVITIPILVVSKIFPTMSVRPREWMNLWQIIF